MPSSLPPLHFPTLAKNRRPNLLREMKIFNWVHRRFNNKAENVKNSDGIGGEDQQFPAEDNGNHVFERWRGGILAIGTLGYDPLKDDDQQLNDYFHHDVAVSCEQYQQHDSDSDESSEDFGEEEGESDEEEENPLVVAAYSYNAEEGLMEEMEENWKHEFEYVMMEKKQRTTLADLFHADTEYHDDVVLKKQTMSKADLGKEKSNRKRRRLLFRNSLIAKDARPIHKLNQLMRRMLKRKIHPDVGPINSKVALPNTNSRTTDDYASLLPTGDANI